MYFWFPSALEHVLTLTLFRSSQLFSLMLGIATCWCFFFNEYKLIYRYISEGLKRIEVLERAVRKNNQIYEKLIRGDASKECDFKKCQTKMPCHGNFRWSFCNWHHLLLIASDHTIAGWGWCLVDEQCPHPRHRGQSTYMAGNIPLKYLYANINQFLRGMINGHNDTQRAICYFTLPQVNPMINFCIHIKLLTLWVVVTFLNQASCKGSSRDWPKPEKARISFLFSYQFSN